MGVYIWSRLPSEYQEVEWIGGNNGNSSSPIVYINTGVASSNNIGCHTEMLHTGTRDNLRFFDNDLLSTTNRWGLVAYPSGNWCPQWGTRIQTNVSYNINQFYDIKLNRNNNKLCTIDGTTIYNCSSASFTGPSIKIGQITYSGNYGWKLKYFKITDGTTLIRDLVPCYRKSDNVIGMYDLVNNQFYTNSGSGTFSKGSDVNTYRESSLKNAYIGGYYEYSYDFTKGSISDLTNQGWTGLSNCSINTTYGLTSSTSWDTPSLSQPKLTSVLSSAKKIKIAYTCYKGTTGNTTQRGFGFRNNGTGNVWIYGDGSAIQLRLGGTLYVNTTSSQSVGTYNFSLDIDLTTKKAVYSGITSGTYTITDSDIATIRTGDELRIAVSSNSYIKNVSILVE